MSFLEMEGKQVVVSGAANGIGASIVRGLLEVGAAPIGVDLEPFSGSELERKIYGLGKHGGEFEFFTGDAANQIAMGKVFETFTKLDGLVNNAGLLGGDNTHGGRSLISFGEMMKAHVHTAIVLTELAHPRMGNNGSIVNVGSIELAMAAPDVVMYTAAKGALFGMTIAYAVTLAEAGIRANMVSPGNVNTERNKAQYLQAKALIEGFERRAPLGRSVEPDEVANIVLFLLSNRSSAITGQDIIVDCGYTRALWDPSWTGAI